MEKSFGSFLKQKRQEKNLTQKDLAKILFVTESAISKWEKDVANPDISMLPKLCEILGVTEHELITASVDNKSREEKAQAKKWRAFSLSWSLFFYISYAIALIPCFICDLAINKGLTWFWIVLSALLLAFCFTNLPKLIKKHKLIIVPLSILLSLCVLLAVCCIYVKGDWFLIAVLSISLGFITIFTPIYISKYKVFNKIKKYADFVSVAVVFIILNILLMVCDFYAVKNGYVSNHWYIKVALPITLFFYLLINLLISIRFVKVNKFFKTSIVLFLINVFLFIPPLFVKVKNKNIQNEIDDANISRADFTRWTTHIDENVSCIVFLSLLGLCISFFVVGLIRYYVKKNRKG